jgi:hypothetical protein
MTHWAYILAAASGPAAFAVWRLARIVLLVVGALTKSEQINKQCERMLILTRRDAKDLLKVQVSSAEAVKASVILPVNALESATDHHACAS